jgi:hypothetical protein
VTTYAELLDPIFEHVRQAASACAALGITAR